MGKRITRSNRKNISKTITQRCIVHIVRNIYGILNKKEAGEVIKDFKKNIQHQQKKWQK